jgi:prepilin-type processing-associated H-X9-DG protein
VGYHAAMRSAFFAVLLALASVSFAQTPGDTVTKFFAAMNRKDFAAVSSLIQGSKATPEFLKMLAQEKSDWPTFTVSDLAQLASGNSAKVTYKLTMSAHGQQHVLTESASLTMPGSGAIWMVVPPSAEPTTEAVLPQIAYMFAHPQKVVINANVAAKRTVCLSNVKQIVLACIMYSLDFDDKFKFRAADYRNAIKPYIKNESLFTCPLDPKGTTSYSFNANLAGVNSEKIAKPAETVLIYEGKNGKLNFRHDGKATVGFADGHAKLISKEDAKRLRWTAK